MAPTVILCSVFVLGHTSTEAAEVTVDLGNAQHVTLVGAINRWDQDGNHRRPVDPKAAIGAPRLDAKATARPMRMSPLNGFSEDFDLSNLFAA